MGQRGTIRFGDYIFSMERKGKSSTGTRTFCILQKISEVKRVEFVSDRNSYIVHRGRWCNIVVLNVFAPRWEKSDDSEDML